MKQRTTKYSYRARKPHADRATSEAIAAGIEYSLAQPGDARLAALANYVLAITPASDPRRHCATCILKMLARAAAITDARDRAELLIKAGSLRGQMVALRRRVPGDYKRAKSLAESYIKRHSGWPGIEALADLAGCTKSEMHKVVCDSPSLLERMRQSERYTPSVRAKLFSRRDEESLCVSDKELDDDTPPPLPRTTGDIWAQVYSLAETPEKRAKLDQMSEAAKLSLIKTIADDKEQLRTLASAARENARKASKPR